jgi:hypothetical protein
LVLGKSWLISGITVLSVSVLMRAVASVTGVGAFRDFLGSSPVLLSPGRASLPCKRLRSADGV